METRRRYAFSWKHIGNLDVGRPNLGPRMRVEVYRLMQYALRDRLEAALGTEGTDSLFREAGRLAGRSFFDSLLAPCPSLDDLLARLPDLLAEYEIGILRVERWDPATGRLSFTVSEDLDCSGLEETGYPICTFDEGFFEGLLLRFAPPGKAVRETDCWCTGARHCRFEIVDA